MEDEIMLFESGDIVVKEEPESDDDLLLKPEHQNGEDSIRRGKSRCQSFDAPPCSAPRPESAGGGPGSTKGLENGLDEEMCTADGERFTVVEAPDGSGDEENENEDGNINEDGEEERNQPFTRMDHVEGEPRVRDNLTLVHSAKDPAQDLFRNTNPSPAEVAEFEMDFQIKEEKLDPGYEAYRLIEEPSLVEETVKAQENYLLLKAALSPNSIQETYRSSGHQYHDDNITREQARSKGFPVLNEEEFRVLNDKYSEIYNSFSEEESNEDDDETVGHYGRRRFLYSDNVALLIESRSDASPSLKKSASKGRKAKPENAKKDGSRKKSKDSSEKRRRSREEELISDVQVYIDHAWEELKKENPDISNIKGIIEKKDGQDDSMIAQYAIIDPEKREMVGIKSVNPKQCHICGKLFEYEFHKMFHVQQVHPDTLKRDKRTVADKSSFNARYNKKCFICKSMEFSHPYYLGLHMREDHPEALIDNTMIQELIRDESGNVTTSKKKCPVCAVVFPFAYQLKYHIQKAHAEVLAEDMRVSMNSRPTNQPESLQDDDAEDEEVKPESEIKIKYTVKDIKSIKNNLQKWNLKKARKRVKGTGLTVERPAKVLKVEKRNETIISQGPNIKRGRGRPRKNRCIVTATSRGRRGRPRKNPRPEEKSVSLSFSLITENEHLKTTKVRNPSEKGNWQDSVIHQNDYPKTKPSYVPLHCIMTSGQAITNTRVCPKNEITTDDENVMADLRTKASHIPLQGTLTTPRGRGRPRKVQHPEKITREDENLMIATASGVKNVIESIVKPDPDWETKASNVALEGTLTTPRGRGRPRKVRHPEDNITTEDENLMTETPPGVENVKESIVNPDADPGTKASNVALQGTFTPPRGRGRPKKVPHPEKEIAVEDENLMTATASGVKNVKESTVEEGPDPGIKASNVSLQGTLITPRGRGRPKKVPHPEKEIAVEDENLMTATSSGVKNVKESTVKQDPDPGTKASNVALQGTLITPRGRGRPKKVPHPEKEIAVEDENFITATSSGVKNVKESTVKQDTDSGTKIKSNVALQGTLTTPRGRGRPRKKPRPGNENTVSPTVTTELENLSTLTVTNASGAGHSLDPIVKEGQSESERAPVTLTSGRPRGRPRKTPQTKLPHIIGSFTSKTHQRRPKKGRTLTKLGFGPGRPRKTPPPGSYWAKLGRCRPRKYPPIKRQKTSMQTETLTETSGTENSQEIVIEQNLGSSMKDCSPGNEDVVSVKAKSSPVKDKRNTETSASGFSDICSDNSGNSSLSSNETIQKSPQKTSASNITSAVEDQARSAKVQSTMYKSLRGTPEKAESCTGVRSQSEETPVTPQRTEKAESCTDVRSRSEETPVTPQRTEKAESCTDVRSQSEETPVTPERTEKAESCTDVRSQSEETPVTPQRTEKAESCTGVRSQSEETPVTPERRSGRKRKIREMTDFVSFDKKLSPVKESPAKKLVRQPSKKKIFENKPNIFCQTCNKVFSGTEAFNEHQSSCTAPGLDSPGTGYYPCIKCPQVFQTVSVHHLHMLRDHGDSSKTCPFCGKPFAFPSAMKKHMVVHTNEAVREALTSLESNETSDHDSQLVNVLSNLGDGDGCDKGDKEKALELSIALNSVSGAKLLVSQSRSSDLDVKSSKSALKGSTSFLNSPNH